MPSLYEITELMEEVTELIDTGEVAKVDMLDTIELIEKEILKNTDNFTKFNIVTKNNISNIDDEIERLRARKKTLENREKYFKEVVTTFMVNNNIKKLRGSLSDISLCYSESVSIPDVTKVNEEWFKTKITKTVSKEEIKKALKRGEVVNGCLLNKNPYLRGGS